jgi:hypothetical protein
VTTALAAADARPKSSVEILVSSEWVRLALTAGAASLRGPREIRAAAGHTLEGIYGDAASTWHVAAARAGRDSLLAAGIPISLLDEVRAALAAADLRLASCVPLFTAALNHLRHELAKPTWFVLAEPTRAVLAYIAGGDLRALRSHRMGAGLDADLVNWLDQCRLQDGVEAQGAELLIAINGAVPVDASRIPLKTRVVDLQRIGPTWSTEVRDAPA